MRRSGTNSSRWPHVSLKTCRARRVVLSSWTGGLQLVILAALPNYENRNTGRFVGFCFVGHAFLCAGFCYVAFARSGRGPGRVCEFRGKTDEPDPAFT